MLHRYGQFHSQIKQYCRWKYWRVKCPWSGFKPNFLCHPVVSSTCIIISHLLLFSIYVTNPDKNSHKYRKFIFQCCWCSKFWNYSLYISDVSLVTFVQSFTHKKYIFWKFLCFLLVCDTVIGSILKSVL